MIPVREKYWRYSLFVLILGIGAVIFVELAPLFGGVLGALTIYILLREQMIYLTERRKWRRSAAATLLLVEAILCFLVPVSLIVWMLVARIQDLVANSQTVVAQLRHFADVIASRTGFDLWEDSSVSSLLGYLSRFGQWLLHNIFSFTLNVIALLFVLYFMLIGGVRMEAYCREILPFNRAVSRDVLREIHVIVRSNAIVIPLLALAQGALAYVGYLIFGAPLPLFWGVATCFATVIPVLGTALVWLPLAAYMALEGRWGMGLGLALYGGLIVTHVDNVMRLLLQKRMADTHPLVTILGVIVGLSLFGFMGVIFGPLIVALFIFFVDIFKRTYLDPHNLTLPSQADVLPSSEA